MDTVARRKRRDPRTLILYAAAILRMFRGTLVFLGCVVIGGAVMYRLTPVPEMGGEHPPWQLSFYGAWMALFAQPIFTRPDHWHLELMHGVYPLFGFVLLGEGIVRFALLMVSRRRGEKEWMLVMASTYRDHIILCGLGNLGYRVLEQLIIQKRDVVVVEKNPSARFAAQARAEGVPLIFRDMKEDDALVEAGIQHAASVILATDDDLANVETAIDARRLNPGVRVAVRLFDQQLAAKLRDVFAFGAPFSSSMLAAPAVAAMAMGNKVVAAFSLAGTAFVAVELTVERRSAMVGASVTSLEAERGVRVLARVPKAGAADLPPAGDAVLDDGDVVTLHVPLARLDEVSALARGGAASRPERS